MTLTNDIAIVTGASSGLGGRFAEVLAAEGAHVICAARRVDRLSALVERIASAGGRAVAVSFDALDPAGPEALVEETLRRAGEPTILVNNAGITVNGRAHELTPDKFDRIMTINVKTPWRLSQLCAARWIAQRKTAPDGPEPRIVNVASIISERVQAGLSLYAMSKAALAHMSASHAREWARFGIRVNALCPGYIRTEINDAYWETEMGKADLARMPRRRVGRPEQLDKALLFLVDPQNDFTNGTALTVDDAQRWAL